MSPMFDVHVTISFDAPVEADTKEEAEFLVSQDEEGLFVSRWLADGDWGMTVAAKEAESSGP